MDPKPSRPPLESLIANEELARRPAREPDHAAENRALVALAERMATSPKDVLEHLVAGRARALLGAVGGHQPGRGATTGSPVFRWRAAAGRFATLVGTGMPRAK